MSDVGQPSIPTLYKRVRKRLLWCRARCTSDYNERHVNTILDGIEAELNRIVNSNPHRDRDATVESLKHLSDHLVALDHQVIDPTIRHFSPLLNVWTAEFDALFEDVKRRPPHTLPRQVQDAVAELERLLDSVGFHPSTRATVPPEDVPLLVAQLEDLIEVVRAFVHPIR